jgi:hypothetical protein
VANRSSEQPADRRALASEVVVKVDCRLRFLDMDVHAAVAQEPEGRIAGLEAELHAPGQDDHPVAVLEELIDVGGLNARIVIGPGLSPVPRAATAGPQLEVLARSDALDLHATP